MMEFCERDINPTEFEYFIGALFNTLGYRIEHNGKTHDGGIDLIVRHFEKGKGVVQVKQYRKNTKVSEPQMRDLYGAMCAKQEVEYGIMVVLSDCTKEAKTWPEREGIKNLKIWTHKQLINLFKENGDQTLIEFIKLLKKHKSDINQATIINNHGVMMTPKHTNNNNNNNNNNYSNYKSNKSKSNRKYHHQVGQPSSALSSAKKRSQKKQNSDRLRRALLNFGNGNGNGDGKHKKIISNNNNMEDMRKNWTNFKFSSGNINLNMEMKQNNGDDGDDEIDKNIEGLTVHSNDNDNKKIKKDNNNQNHIEQEQKVDNFISMKKNNQIQDYLSPNNNNDVNLITSSGEPSPISSTDSSLLIDESQDSDDDNDNDNDNDRENVIKKRINESFSNSLLSNMNDVNGDNNNNIHNFLWLLNNSKPKRRSRRKWLVDDDVLLLNMIKSFGSSWNDTPEQWQHIIDNCRFSQQFTIKDVKKHWLTVLKPKLFNQPIIQ